MTRTGPSITDAARTLVGTVTARYTSEPVSLRQVREYVAATGGDLADWPANAAPGHVPYRRFSSMPPAARLSRKAISTRTGSTRSSG